MKKKLNGYFLVYARRDQQPLPLTIEEGRGIMSALASNASFVRIDSRDLTIRANAIDFIEPNYEDLEEKCMFCRQLKPKRMLCPNGCEDKRR